MIEIANRYRVIGEKAARRVPASAGSDGIATQASRFQAVEGGKGGFAGGYFAASRDDYLRSAIYHA